MYHYEDVLGQYGESVEWYIFTNKDGSKELKTDCTIVAIMHCEEDAQAITNLLNQGVLKYVHQQTKN